MRDVNWLDLSSSTSRVQGPAKPCSRVPGGSSAKIVILKAIENFWRRQMYFVISKLSKKVRQGVYYFGFVFVDGDSKYITGNCRRMLVEWR